MVDYFGIKLILHHTYFQPSLRWLKKIKLSCLGWLKRKELVFFHFFQKRLIFEVAQLTQFTIFFFEKSFILKKKLLALHYKKKFEKSL